MIRQALRIWVLQWALLVAVASAAAPVPLSYEILQTRKHDAGSFTQGLLQDENGLLWESSGLYRRSFIQVYDPVGETAVKRQSLPSKIFAEGIALLGDRLYVLTWKAGLLLVLDRDSLQTVQTHLYEGEGWGLTHDGSQFFMSNGSDKLLLRDDQTFAVQQTLEVRDAKRRWSNLNELEYAEGLIWANVWQTPYVIAIDPTSGQVRAKVDFTELVEVNSRQPGHTVLNGVAYNPVRGSFWVTGKLWPNLYEVCIDLSPLQPTPAGQGKTGEAGSGSRCSAAVETPAN